MKISIAVPQTGSLATLDAVETIAEFGERRGLHGLWVLDRLVLMDRGRLVADGHPSDVLTPARLEQVFGVSGAFVPTPAGPVFVTLPPPPASCAPAPPEP